MFFTKPHSVKSRMLETLRKSSVFSGLLATYAFVQIFLMVLLWSNHIGFPLNLEAMELTVLQHLKRLMDGLPLYPEPTPDFVALAYNPLYYFLAVPFAWVFGTNLFTLRFVSLLGAFGAGIVLFLAVRKETGANWWGLMASGLFAAAYQAMDIYLDTAHRDSWLVFMLLLGCYLIGQRKSLLINCIGIICMVLAFWLKQQGALFLLGSLLYLVWRDGWRKAMPFWLLATALGPILYMAIPDWMLGSRFHYFTWQVPRHWTEPTYQEFFHLIRLVLRSYSVLFAIAISVSVMAFLKRKRRIDVWNFMFPFTLISGFTAALLPASNDNVYIPMGSWFIIVSVIGLKQLADSWVIFKRRRLHLILLAASFALFLYNPLPLLSSSQSAMAYRDLVSYLNSLNGTVYAPWIGQLQDGYRFYPAAHWVPLEDLIRGPGVDEKNQPIIRTLLEPVLNPQGKAYILHNQLLQEDRMLSFLADQYILDADLGDRFQPLSTLPRRFSPGYPRYIYRYVKQEKSN